MKRSEKNCLKKESLKDTKNRHFFCYTCSKSVIDDGTCIMATRITKDGLVETCEECIRNSGYLPKIDESVVKKAVDDFLDNYEDPKKLEGVVKRRKKQLKDKDKF